MDLRESRIVDGIRELTHEEAVSVGMAIGKSVHLKPAVRVKWYLLEQLKMHVERLEANDASEPSPPGFADMDIDAIAEWLAAVPALNNGFRAAGNIERLVDAIVEVAAAHAAAVLGALHEIGVRA